MSRAGFAFTVCLVGPIVAGCSYLEDAVKKQVRKEMAEVQEKTQKQVEAVQEKAEKDAALAQERAEEIRAKAKEQITKIKQTSDEEIAKLKARLQKVSESVVSEGQAFEELHKDDRKQKYP